MSLNNRLKIILGAAVIFSLSGIEAITSSDKDYLGKNNIKDYFNQTADYKHNPAENQKKRFFTKYTNSEILYSIDESLIKIKRD